MHIHGTPHSFCFCVWPGKDIRIPAGDAVRFEVSRKGQEVCSRQVSFNLILSLLLLLAMPSSESALLHHSFTMNPHGLVILWVCACSFNQTYACVHNMHRLSEEEDDGGGNKAVELVFIEKRMHPGLGIPGSCRLSRMRCAASLGACQMHETNHQQPNNPNKPPA